MVVAGAVVVVAPSVVVEVAGAAEAVVDSGSVDVTAEEVGSEVCSDAVSDVVVSDCESMELQPTTHTANTTTTTSNRRMMPTCFPRQCLTDSARRQPSHSPTRRGQEVGSMRTGNARNLARGTAHDSTYGARVFPGVGAAGFGVHNAACETRTMDQLCRRSCHSGRCRVCAVRS